MTTKSRSVRTAAFLTVIFALGVLLLADTVCAGEPADFVRRSVDDVLSILRDPAYETASEKEEQRRKLRAIADRMFSVEELSNRTLARNRKRFSSAQMDEFKELFPDLLEDAYIDKIQSYTNERVVYGRETMHTPEKAEVSTTIVSSTGEIPITYRLILKEDSWKIYDVLVEGVSLVKNYRSQFNEILRKKKPEGLLEMLRKKVRNE